MKDKRINQSTKRMEHVEGCIYFDFLFYISKYMRIQTLFWTLPSFKEKVQADP